MAIAWVLRDTRVTTALVGASRWSQIEDSLGALDNLEFSDGELDAIDRFAVEGGIDFVVAQGWEAGGHVSGQVATLPLVRTTVEAVAPVPVIAAGGIADGPGLAAVLVLGAAGAWIGTRFMASQEAAIHPRFREMLLASKETDTIYTQLFDVGWPGRPHRVLRNKTVTAWEAAGSPPSSERPGEGELVGTSKSRGPIVRYQSTTPPLDADGDIEAFSLFAGQGVGLLSKEQSAADIVHEISQEAEAALHRLSPT